MEREDKITEIKKDFRQMRKLRHSRNSALELLEKRGKMLTVVNESPSLSESERISISADIHSTIEFFGAETEIKQFAELEARYAPVISKLSAIDRAIIIEAFLEGKTYKDIGEQMYYSSESVRKRANKLLFKIAENL